MLSSRASRVPHCTARKKLTGGAAAGAGRGPGDHRHRIAGLRVLRAAESQGRPRMRQISGRDKSPDRSHGRPTALGHATLPTSPNPPLRLPQGLAFLAKKSWHTSNLNNQERVWLAEQKAAAEEKKMKELQQQIKLEREREEFQRLAGKSKSGTGDRGTDWMYQEGGSRPGEEESQEAKDAKMAAEDRKNEEYLLGKHYAPEGQGRHTGDFAVASAIESGALQKASTAGASIGASDGNGAALRLEDAEPAAADGASGQVTEWNQDFHLRHHDPMFAVQQQRLAKLSDVEKKRRLMERAGIDVRLVHRTAGGDDVPAPGGE
ncbi:hypothetical protein THAOC_31115, partial [Thalassiosira oceanica]